MKIGRWPLTFFVATLPPGSAGVANGPVIRILEENRADEGIYQHELEHVKQWLSTLGLHSLLYLLLKPYRLWAEVAAYRVQMRYPDKRGGRLDTDQAALFISRDYGLDISVERARQLLTQ